MKRRPDAPRPLSDNVVAARRARVLKLRRAVRGGLYDVPANSVARAILRQWRVADYEPVSDRPDRPLDQQR